MAPHGILQGYRGYADTHALGAALKALQEEGLDQLPLPGSGQTLERFSRLAQVAGIASNGTSFFVSACDDPERYDWRNWGGED